MKKEPREIERERDKKETAPRCQLERSRAPSENVLVQELAQGCTAVAVGGQHPVHLRLVVLRRVHELKVRKNVFAQLDSHAPSVVGDWREHF